MEMWNIDIIVEIYFTELQHFIDFCPIEANRPKPPHKIKTVKISIYFISSGEIRLRGSYYFYAGVKSATKVA